MSDFLGPIAIPDPPSIGPFPLIGDYGSGFDYTPPIATHVFDQPGLKTEQRFILGSGQRRFRVSRQKLSCNEYDQLKAHFLEAQGLYATFSYNCFGPNGLETYNVRYENPNITFNLMVGMLTSDPGVTLLEVPTVTPDHQYFAVVERFPDSLFTEALRGEVQTLIPLLAIQPRTPVATDQVPDPATPAAALISNQRFTLADVNDPGNTTNLYLPRLQSWSGISQSIGSASDGAQFTLGNADSVFVQWANAVNLYRAQVAFGIFHVESKYLLQLWAGYATQWGFDAQGHFTLGASDGAFAMGLPYPTRLVSRTCWKKYKGIFCPSTSSLPTCPKDFDSCVERGVPHSYGGVVLPATAIHIADSTTGVYGFGRSVLTSVTIASDTIYQRPIQEVYTDQPMPVNVDGVAGARDESDFLAAIGIVSEGPVGKYSPALGDHLLDGQPPHDPKDNQGFRGILGNDPAADSDFFALDQAPWGVPPVGSTWAAGTAFAEIRRTDSPGLQLTAVEDHTMSVLLDEGIGGWIWNGPGDRQWFEGLGNVVWVAVNVYLRGIGLRCDPTRANLIPSEVMEQFVDVEQATAAAAICDIQVPKLIGDGNERQFPFRGILKERKPLKDWLTEILNCGLGYFTFKNGKLWIGIRENSSVLAGNAFTRATILYQSLNATPISPQFNWLTVQFGDEEFAYALNNVTTYDIDHAMTVGTEDSPNYLSSTMSLVGVSNKSQAARICATRLREEVGGVGPVEQANARAFSFRTTILALQTQVGDIVSMTHDDLPTGYAEGRVQNWTLNPDFSIDISASPTTDAMYDLDAGPKPVDVPADPVPPELLPAIAGLAWMPNTVAPFAGDPLYPDAAERTFALSQDYSSITKDGVWAPALVIVGEECINEFVAPVQPRIFDPVLATGGTLSGKQAVYFAVTVRDADGKPATPSNLSGIQIPAGATNQKITISAVPPPDPATRSRSRLVQIANAPLPTATTWAGWDLWAGFDRRLIGKQVSGDGALPATIDLLAVHPMTQGMPEQAATSVAVKVKAVRHSGIAGVTVSGVTAPNIIQVNEAIGSDTNWIGRYASALADFSDGSAPLWNFEITAFNSVTGEFTVTPDCIRADPADSVDVGDVFIIRHWADSVSADLMTITDPLWDNSIGEAQFGADGLAPDSEKGNIARILRGKGAGQFRYITTNDELTYTVSPAWDVAPDKTSVIIIESPDYVYSTTSSALDVPSMGIAVTLRVRVDNLANRVALVGGFLVDSQGNLSDEQVAVFREIYVFGAPPQVRTVGPEANDPNPDAAGAPWQADEFDQTIRVDNSQNDVNINLPPLAVYEGRTLYIVPDPAGAYNAIVNTYPGETFWDGSTQITVAPGETSRITAGGNYGSSTAAKLDLRQRRGVYWRRRYTRHPQFPARHD
jgi:hypothetical protein